MTIAATVTTLHRPGKSDLRDRIVAAAWEIVRESTPSGLTIRSIATRAGVSPALLYTYFEGKAALVRELQRIAMPQLDAQLGSAIEGADTPSERLARVCLAYVDYARQHRWLVGGEPEKPRPDGSSNVLTATFLARVAALLEAQGAGRTRAEALQIAINALIAGEWESELERQGGGQQRFVESYVRMILDGVARP